MKKQIIKLEQTLKDTYTPYKIINNISSELNVSKEYVRGTLELYYHNLDKLKENTKIQKSIKQYGLCILRAQPFHFGHSHIINEIILDGLTPIVVIGSDKGNNTQKNPLKPSQVQELIEIVYPGICEFIVVYDSKNWSEWFSDIINGITLTRTKEQITLYYHNKECDRYKSFECLGQEYKNTFYTDIFHKSIKMKPIEFVKRSDIHIDANATNIRDNFEKFKHLLDGRVYYKLKEWGW